MNVKANRFAVLAAKTIIGYSFILLGGCIVESAPDSIQHSGVVFPSDAGVIDVTKPPYNAKGDGITDDTSAINKALRDHNSANSKNVFMSWTIYFPAGIYLVSDSLEPKDPVDPTKNRCSVRLVGQGVDKTVIRLKDNAKGFGDPANPRYVLRTGNHPEVGGHPNSGFGNYIQHLTVDVGSGNPGAGGIRYDVANCGSLSHVRIISCDPGLRGAYGLGFFGQCGAGYVKDLSVDGFDYGIYFDKTEVNNLVLEHVHVRNQLKSGILNEGKNIQVRDLVSHNKVTGLTIARSCASTILIDSRLDGRNEGSAVKLLNPSYFYARKVISTGYPVMIELPAGLDQKSVPEREIAEWSTYSNAMPCCGKSFDLPVLDAPEYNTTDFSEWANVVTYGAIPDDQCDDSDGIQAAIDSGKKIVYFPRGEYTLKNDIVVRGTVQKIDFLFSLLKADAGATPAIRVNGAKGSQIILENMAIANNEVRIIHDSLGTTVIRNRGGFGKILTGEHASGNLFVETAGPNCWIEVKNGVHAWLRAVNRECSGLLNDGSVVWIFGDNVERMKRGHAKNGGGGHIWPVRTINRGITEYIGGAIDALWVAHVPQDGPLFECIDSSLSAVYAGELWDTDRGKGAWPLHVMQVTQGEQKRITDSQALIFKNPEDKVFRYVMPKFVIGTNGFCH